jgi:8-oxo-dGTP pyrophosphatase MutT (NUDIX family)
MEVREDFSAGGVARDTSGRVAVVVVETMAGTHIHALPKGHLEDGETDLVAALREVREETGLEVVADDRRAPTEIGYEFIDRDGALVQKRVRFFPMRVVGGSVLDHDHEVIEAMLLSHDEALARLHYASEREVLQALCD